MKSSTPPIIKVKNLSKSFSVGGQNVRVLRDVSFNVNSQDFIIIIGPSGCGKSTLLHTILGLEPPSDGSLSFLSSNIYQFTEDQRTEFRKQHIGMVYQQPNWIRSLTVVENVAFPLFLFGYDRSFSLNKAKKILLEVGMESWSNYMPTELSSGQQQRVALTRALITDPEVIIADEPTGNLDYEGGVELMELLVRLNHQQKKTIIMVTHDIEYLQYAKTALRMFNGEILGIYQGKQKEKLLHQLMTKANPKS